MRVIGDQVKLPSKIEGLVKIEIDLCLDISLVPGTIVDGKINMAANVNANSAALNDLLLTIKRHPNSFGSVIVGGVVFQ